MTGRNIALGIALWFAIGFVGALIFGVPNRSNYACAEQGSVWGRSGPGCDRYVTTNARHGLFEEDPSRVFSTEGTQP
jgi:hypothetical protein